MSPPSFDEILADVAELRRELAKHRLWNSPQFQAWLTTARSILSDGLGEHSSQYRQFIELTHGNAIIAAMDDQLLDELRPQLEAILKSSERKLLALNREQGSQSRREDSAEKRTSIGSEVVSEVDIFISHASADKEIACLLTDLVSKAFVTERIRCTSVPGYRLEAGRDTDEQLLQELRSATVCIGIVTETSLASAYVLFELGARWALQLHLAPVLAAGASTAILRGPLSGKHIPELTSKTDVTQLLQDIGNRLGRAVNLAACSSAIDRLVERNAELAEQAEPSPETRTETHGFEELRGAFWKIADDGTVSEDPYCPTCKTVLTSTSSGDMPCVCTKCSFTTPFFKRDVAQLRAQLMAK